MWTAGVTPGSCHSVKSIITSALISVKALAQCSITPFCPNQQQLIPPWTKTHLQPDHQSLNVQQIFASWNLVLFLCF